jgi:hypothetical protein
LFGGFLRIETDASAVIIKRIVDAYRAKVCTLAESGCFIALNCCKYNPISENQTQNTQTTAKKVTNPTALLRITSMLFLNIAGAGFASQGDAERAMKMCPLHMGCTWVAHGLHMAGSCAKLCASLCASCACCDLLPFFLNLCPFPTDHVMMHMMPGTKD